MVPLAVVLSELAIVTDLSNFNEWLTERAIARARAQQVNLTAFQRALPPPSVEDGTLSGGSFRARHRYRPAQQKGSKDRSSRSPVM